MGTVYKVQHLISDRIEAMKVILPELIDSPELAERFIREIKLQARLSHPHIASLHNALRLDQQLLMVMEYIDGTTLYAHLKRSPRMEPETSIGIVLQVLSGLAYAHRQNVIHRDIKPANIMFTANGTVKIMDFGIARSLSEKHDITRTGAALGSLYYMSPEQVQGGSIDNRSDLYSVGVLLYEMVTGSKPITGETSWAIMNAHLSQVPRAPAALNNSVPGTLSLAILRALEKNPAARYQSAEEFTEILQAVRTHLPAHGAGKGVEGDTVALPPGGHISGSPQARAASHSDVAVAGVATPTPGGQPTPTPRTGSGPASGASHFDRNELDRVKRELAIYVGPMARIIVDRAVKKAANWQQLYEILSAEVPAGEERKSFLRTRPR